MSFKFVLGVCMNLVKIVNMDYYVDISFTFYNAILTVFLILYKI
jgi:hypothetical protein